MMEKSEESNFDDYPTDIDENDIEFESTTLDMYSKEDEIVETKINKLKLVEESKKSDITKDETDSVTSKTTDKNSKEDETDDIENRHLNPVGENQKLLTNDIKARTNDESDFTIKDKKQRQDETAKGGKKIDVKPKGMGLDKKSTINIREKSKKNTKKNFLKLNKENIKSAGRLGKLGSRKTGSTTLGTFPLELTREDVLNITS